MPSLSPQQNTLLMNHIEETLRWLDSDMALALMAQDAYWPKWETPWWRMLLLYELEPSLPLPERIVQELVDSLNKKLHHTFPILASELPEGIDPQIPCHCQIGNMGQVLAANGVDLDQALPWIRPWMLRYQLPDGGLNCDETAYNRPHPHSSVVRWPGFSCQSRSIPDRPPSEPLPPTRPRRNLCGLVGALFPAFLSL